MLKKIGPKLYIALHRFFSRFHNQEESIDILSLLANAKNVLICLPNEYDGIKAFFSTIDAIKGIFPRSKKKVLLRSSGFDYSKYKEDLQIIEYGIEEITGFGLPSQSLKNQVLTADTDILLDLNRQMNPVTAVIACASSARLKITFTNPSRDDLYNFLVRILPDQNWENAFKVLFNYLRTS
jgi:hypothetical protein